MHFLTPVWGDPYVRLYLDVIIPSQLASQNLPVFSSDLDTRYTIYTTETDKETIRSAPIFDLLKSVISVSFEPVDMTVKIPHDRMSDCFRRGIESANRADAAIVFLTPDIVFADGAFATLKRLSGLDCSVVFVPAIRTLKQGVSATLNGKFKAEGVIRIGPRDLMRTALDNLHPLAGLSWWNEGEADLLPANLYWRVDSEGILARCFHLHPIYVRPQRKHVRFFGTVDDDFCSAACPDRAKDYVVSDSDELLGIELSDPSHFFRTGFAKGSIKDTVTWAEQYTNERHRTLFNHTIRMHTGVRNADLWFKAAHEADQVATNIQSKLAKPTWRLMVPPSPLLLRRAYRRAFDRLLRLANQPKNLARARTDRLSLIDHWHRLPIGLLGVYRSFTRIIKRQLVGPDAIPFFFTSNYLIQHLLRRGLRDYVNPIGRIVLITEASDTSPLRSVLEAEGPSIPIAMPVQFDGESRCVMRDTGEALAPESLDLALLELGELRAFDRYLSAVQPLLRPNGRVVVSMNRLLSSKPSFRRDTLDQQSMANLMTPGYSVVSHKRLGGVGSSFKLILCNKVYSEMRRGPVLVRLLELSFAWLWVPLLIVCGGMINLLALFVDLFDRKKADAVLSLTIADKTSNSDK